MPKANTVYQYALALPQLHDNAVPLEAHQCGKIWTGAKQFIVMPVSTAQRYA